MTSLATFTPNTSDKTHASDSFVDSVGVNVDLVHIAPGDIDSEAAEVAQAHLRHVRIAILQNDAPYNAVVRQFLQGSGAKALGLTNCAPPLGPYPLAVITAQNVRDFQAAIGGGLEAYEAMNEPDARSGSDPNWVADLKSCMQAQTGVNLPFIAPAISDEVHYGASLGNLASVVQGANSHRYFAGRNPDTSGWGGTFACGVYGALSWALCEAAITAPQTPVYITETGYNSNTEVDLATQGKYLLRTLLVNYRAGVTRTYIYSLMGYTGSDGFGGDGLIDPSQTPKPSYRAITTALSLLNDPGANPSTSSLSYYLSASKSVEHILFRRSDGSYVLALWNETQSWNPNGGGQIAVPAQSVTIGLPFRPVSALATTISDTGQGVTSAVASNGTSFTLPIDDHVTFISFHA